MKEEKKFVFELTEMDLYAKDGSKAYDLAHQAIAELNKKFGCFVRITNASEIVKRKEKYIKY